MFCIAKLHIALENKLSFLNLKKGHTMSHVSLNLTPELYVYLHKNSLRESATLKALREETKDFPGAVMQISPEQGQFFALLVQLMHAKKTLDIGTYTGYSALAVALALPEDGKVITCDINAEATTLAARYWAQAQVQHKINLRLQPALQTLHELIESGASNTFDFIFIDADKNNYPQYYELSLQLLRPQGLLAIDNVLWGGTVVDPNDHDATTKMFRKYNQDLLVDERIMLSMLPVGDGLTLAMKR